MLTQSWLECDINPPATAATRILGSDAALFARIREINQQIADNNARSFDAACLELSLDMEATRNACVSAEGRVA